MENDIKKILDSLDEQQIAEDTLGFINANLETKIIAQIQDAKS